MPTERSILDGPYVTEREPGVFVFVDAPPFSWKKQPAKGDISLDERSAILGQGGEPIL